jgi:hypothetical protein
MKRAILKIGWPFRTTAIENGGYSDSSSGYPISSREAKFLDGRTALRGLEIRSTRITVLAWNDDDRSQAARGRRAAARSRSVVFMKERLETNIRRRDLLGLAIVGVGAAAASVVVLEPVDAKPIDLKDKRKARYQASSTEVRDFYRVNSYPVR